MFFLFSLQRYALFLTFARKITQISLKISQLLLISEKSITFASRFPKDERDRMKDKRLITFFYEFSELSLFFSLILFPLA